MNKAKIGQRVKFDYTNEYNFNYGVIEKIEEGWVFIKQSLQVYRGEDFITDRTRARVLEHDLKEGSLILLN